MSSNTTGTVLSPPATTSSAQCVMCSNTLQNDLFLPYCSLSCARAGVSKRYGLLRVFIDFESKYVNPPKRVKKPLDAPSKQAEGTEATEEKHKKPKK